MARVNVLREIQSGEAGEWRLCFHWCRYVLDDDQIQYGYRFVWRRDEDGSIQAARGQARIPSLAHAQQLMSAAVDAGWGDRDGYELELSAKRLEQAGCVVDFGSGYVGWPDNESSLKNNLSPDRFADVHRLQDWTR